MRDESFERASVAKHVEIRSGSVSRDHALHRLQE